MKIAIPINENGILEDHFGHCKYFAVLEINNNEIVSEEIIEAPPHQPGLLPEWLSELGATDILSAGMGNRAIQLLNNKKVNVYVGAPKLKARDLVSGYLDNSIEFRANLCDH